MERNIIFHINILLLQSMWRKVSLIKIQIKIWKVHLLKLQNNKSSNVQGVPKNMGIQWRIRYRLWYELAL